MARNGCVTERGWWCSSPPIGLSEHEVLASPLIIISKIVIMNSAAVSSLYASLPASILSPYEKKMSMQIYVYIYTYCRMLDTTSYVQVTICLHHGNYLCAFMFKFMFQDQA